MDTDCSPRRRFLGQPLARLLALLACLAFAGAFATNAQDTAGDNPTGPSGVYNGEVTTAGMYDPATISSRRTVTDLVVPGSNGTYPLAFTRYYNSTFYDAGQFDKMFFGDANWRHSYQWTLVGTETSSATNQVTAYTVAYPSGEVVTFRPNRPEVSRPATEYATYWHGPTGTSDRLEVPSSAANGTHTNCLHTADGGTVYFGNGSNPTTITDPYGAVTTLTYDTAGTGALMRVTEPGGRWLHFVYATVTYQPKQGAKQTTWYVMTQVQSGYGNTTQQTATYNYTLAGYDDRLQGNTAYDSTFELLTGVNYDTEASVSGSGNVQAAYAYQANTAYLISANDPHYAGAMTQIQYPSVPTSTSAGLNWEERNASTGAYVSHLVRDYNANTATETRGDTAAGGTAITRMFRYNEGTGPYQDPNDGTDPVSKPSQLTSYTDWEGHNTYLTYYSNTGSDASNGAGNLRNVTDAMGRTTTYGHEPITNKVSALTMPDGRLRKWDYLSKDLSETAVPSPNPYYLYRFTDERGQQTIYHRFPNTGLVSEIDYPDGTNEQFVYSGFNSWDGNSAYCKIGYHKTRLGAQIYYSYNADTTGAHNDLLTAVTRYYNDGSGNMRSEVTYFEYDALGRLTKTTDPRGVATSFTYNARHQLVQTTHASDGTYVYRWYDDTGNCTDVQDEMGHVSHTLYDGYRRPTSVTVPINANGIASRTISTTYDGRDNGNNVIAPATSHTDARWSYQVLPSGRGVQRVYSANGWLRDEYSGLTNGNQSGYAFTQSLHDKQSLQYDACGFLTASTDAQGQTWYAALDQYGRPSTTTDPLGHTTTTSYYASNSAYAGLVQSVSAPGNNAVTTATTQYAAYDANGRLTGWVDPANNGFGSSYDAAGDLVSQSDGMPTSGNGAHPAMQYSYDQLGRKTGITYADTTYEAWTYDASGNLASYLNRAGKTQTYNSYDARNRPTGYSWNDGVTPTAGISFDAAGRCTFYSNGYSRLDMTYDDSGALLTEKQSIGGGTNGPTISYTPDADGNVAAISYPHGDTAHFYFDYLGRLQTLGFAYGSNPQGVYSMASYNYSGTWLANRQTAYNVLTQYGYQANGRVLYVDQQNTSPSRTFNHQTYGYNPDGQLSWTVASASGSGDVFNQNGYGDTYQYDADGKIATHYIDAQNVNANTNYGGDVPANNPPTSPHRADAFQYDAAGNRTYDCEAGLATIQAYDAEDRQTDRMNYDTHGNVTYMPYSPTNSAGMQYAYDGFNQLISANGNGHSAGFAYDPKGRLCQRTIDGVTRNLYYVGDQVVEEDDGAGNKICFYLYGKLGREFRIDSTVTLYHYDGRGWLSHITDINGNVVEQYHYDAYGMPRVYSASGQTFYGNASTLSGGNRYVWNQGYEWYPEIGLYRCGARFYAPTWGHWMQPDPIGQAGGLNIYAYCGNDPINGSDPSGLDDDGLQGGTYTPRDYSGADGNTYSGGEISGGPYNGWWKDTTWQPPGDRVTINAPYTDPALYQSSYSSVGTPTPAAGRDSGAIGAPGLLVGSIPILGNTLNSINAFQTGHPWVGTFYAAMAVSDCFLVKAAMVGIAKGGVILASKLLLKEGGEIAAEGGGGVLFRFGSEAPTLETLSGKASEAVEAGFPHGVSSSTKLPPKFANNFRSALRSDVEQHFEVRQTGKNPFHHTVVLPQPVTQETVDLFNSLFQ